jgi:hypothetical protein
VPDPGGRALVQSRGAPGDNHQTLLASCERWGRAARAIRFYRRRDTGTQVVYRPVLEKTATAKSAVLYRAIAAACLNPELCKAAQLSEAFDNATNASDPV